MNLAKLFNWSYLTNRYAVENLSWWTLTVLFIIFGLALIVAFLATKKLKDPNTNARRFLIKLQIWGFSSSIVGAALIFFRQVRAMYLSSRIWLLLWIIIVLVWLGFLIYEWKVILPKKKQDQKSQEEFNKWLPKKKN